MDTALSFVKKPEAVKKESFHRFNRWSKKYDRSILQILLFDPSHQALLKNISSDKTGINVLDIGCGTGEFALKLKNSRSSVHVSGIDISSDMITAAKEKSGQGSDFDIDFRVGDAEHIPFENNRFDYITCSHSFHHYPHKRKALGEMFRVLKNNGKLMVADGCKDHIFGKFIFDFLVKRHEVNVHHLNKGQFQRLFSSAGFANITQTIFNPIIPTLLTIGHARKEAAA